jgi:methionine synthase II (cobalamin-independent)
MVRYLNLNLASPQSSLHNKMAPPFRAEQIGSLLRPADLLSARKKSDSTTSYAQNLPDDVKRLTKEAIASVVQKQLSLSIRPITSGEFERHIFYGGFFENIDGFEVLPELPLVDGFRTKFPTTATLINMGIKTRPGVVATGKIKHVKSPYLEEWETLKGLLKPEQWKDAKLTIPSPTWQHMQLAKGTAYSLSVYSSDKEYFTDLAAAFKAEFQTLYSAGIRSIQIDDPNLTFFMTDDFLEGCKLDGIDPDELLDLYIWAHNACLSNLPTDLHVGIHLCRGNMASSTHVVSGSYERIAKRIFEGLDYQTYYLEYDSDRAGDFEPLRHLPVGKNVVLGVVSTKDSKMESLDALIGKVNSAADVIARGQGKPRQEVIQSALGVSPQCGFASMSQGGGVGMTEEKMWEKLVLVRDLARKIWSDAV